MDKMHVKKTMLALTEGEMLQAKKKYEVFLSSAMLERSETIESDEKAQAETAADLAEAFDDKVHSYAEKLETINKIDFTPKSEVAPGAVVRIGARHLVVAVSTAEFVCQDNSFIGISTSAPIYNALEGKVAGDVCTFNGREIHVDEVF